MTPAELERLIANVGAAKAAAQCGVTRQTVWRWRTGQTAIPARIRRQMPLAWRIPVSMIPTQNQLLRMHWRARGRAKRELAWMFAASAPAEPLRRTRVTVRRFSTRMLDPDNLVASCKLPLDALQDARIIAGDDTEHVALIVTQERVAARADARVEIAVEERK